MKENEDITKYVIREIDPPIFIHPYIGHDIVDMTIEEIKSKLPDDEQK